MIKKIEESTIRIFLWDDESIPLEQRLIEGRNRRAPGLPDRDESETAPGLPARWYLDKI